MRKGFTLIELLAVIVILAIISLISVPIVLNLINDSKNESNKRSIDLYGKAIELAMARKSLIEEVPTGNYKTNGNTLTLNNSEFILNIEYEGSKVECDTIKINDDGTLYLGNCKVNGVSVDYSYGQTYEELEYLEGTGTQYIDTLVNAESGLRFNFKMSINELKGNQVPIGAIGEGTVRFYPLNGKNSYWEIGYSSYYKTSSDIELNTIYIVDAKMYQNEQSIFINDEEIYHETNEAYINTSKNLYLFADNYKIGDSGNFYGKIYNCKIWKDDTLIRDFIPVLDKNGKPCMYDKVEEKFYYNKGTGDFKYELKS